MANARIPDVNRMQRRQVNLSVPQVRPAAVGPSSLGILAGGVADMSATFAQEEQDIAAEQTAQAESDFLVFKAGQDQKSNESRDWKGMASEYGGTMSEQMGTIAAGIANPQARLAFVEKHRVSVERGRQRVAGRARAVERDEGRATIGTKVEELTRAMVQSQDPEFLAQSSEALKGMYASRHYTKQEAASKIKSALNGVALGRVQIASNENPHLARKMLDNKQLTANIDPVQLSNLKKKVGDRIKLKDKEDVDQWAQDGAEEIGTRHDSFNSDVVKEIMATKDVDKQDALMKRTKAYYSAKNLAEKAESTDAHHELYDSVAGGGSMADNPELVSKLLPAHHASMMEVERQTQSGIKVPFNYDMDETLVKLAQAGQYEGIKDLVKSGSHLLSKGQRASWWKAARKGAIPPELDDHMTDLQLTNLKIDPKEDKDANRRLRGDLRQWRLNYQRLHKGNEPDDGAREDFMGKWFMKYKREGSFWGTDEVVVGTLPESEQLTLMAEYKEKDPVLWNRLALKMQAHNVQLSPAVYLAEFQRLQQAKYMHELEQVKTAPTTRAEQDEADKSAPSITGGGGSDTTPSITSRILENFGLTGVVNLISDTLVEDLAAGKRERVESELRDRGIFLPKGMSDEEVKQYLTDKGLIE